MVISSVKVGEWGAHLPILARWIDAIERRGSPLCGCIGKRCIFNSFQMEEWERVCVGAYFLLLVAED